MVCSVSLAAWVEFEMPHFFELEVIEESLVDVVDLHQPEAEVFHQLYEIPSRNQFDRLLVGV